MSVPAKKNRHWLLNEKFGSRVVKDGCGVFGILRKGKSAKIPSVLAVRGISSAKYRGSHLGAGYASFNADKEKDGSFTHRIMAFVKDETVAKEIERELLEVGSTSDQKVSYPKGTSELIVWEALLHRKYNLSDQMLEARVDQINFSLISDSEIKGRIFSYGRYVKVYKEVGYPQEVADMYGLNGQSNEADMWIAHTRQPTNSPGNLPVWSHPFASMDCAIVHNGDISSFGANVELLKSWNLVSHIGTDSEVIARLLDRLLREERLDIKQAATILTSPFEERGSKEALELMVKNKGARLDGPFAVVAGYCDGDDCFLIALTDRSKFRPLILGEDESNFYVASEESQIRLLSQDAVIWTPEPGSFFIASRNRGLIESATTRDARLQESVLKISRQKSRAKIPSIETISAMHLESGKINEVLSEAYHAGKYGINFTDLYGQRYIGIGFSPKKRSEISPHFRIELEGYPGNCLANLNDGGVFEIFGNVADDVGDTMHSGSIIVHGNARDVLGQALQGGSILVRGSVGNRAGIQMREYHNSRPFLIIGETADDYLGEYTAGGIICVLNLSDSQKPVGYYVGTGMVGGRIYVRGKVASSQIGLPPCKEDVFRYLKVVSDEGRITKECYDEISKADFPSVQLLRARLPKVVFDRVEFLFFSNKYSKPLSIDRRKLNEFDKSLFSDPLDEFCKVFSISEGERWKIMDSEFTVIQTGEEEILRPVPPQEIPVEE
jgi:glutamate synthase domain-containing protein 1/glutamate synthase domain-containing protein 3